MYQNIDIIESHGPSYIVVLAGDHVYKMDYEPMLQQHVEQEADVTVGCIEVPRLEASGFGVMHVDENDRHHLVPGEAEGPARMPDKPDMALASMGIYVFETRFPVSTNFGAMPASRIRAAISARTSSRYIVEPRQGGRAPLFQILRADQRSSEAYWRDVGTIDAYWEANIDLTGVVPALDLYDRDWPIWTYAEITAAREIRP